LLFVAPSLRADDAAGFEAANKLYEQNKYAQAAAAYEKLIQTCSPSETLYFNVGNAWFKAGQVGRAIAAWRQGERLAPRDPSLRFNLQFARRKVSGSDSPASGWQRALTALTLNEWSILTSVALWLWLVLLAIREARPLWRPALRGYTATAGATVFVLVACVAAAASFGLRANSAVVIVPEAIVRTGPLEEARMLHQFRDGVEVEILDRKELNVGDHSQAWLQVRDSANRTGWLKEDQVIVLQAASVAPPTKSLVINHQRPVQN
jgi:tetratricopeptide (TPR) repeat protein